MQAIKRKAPEPPAAQTGGSVGKGKAIPKQLPYAEGYCSKMSKAIQGEHAQWVTCVHLAITGPSGVLSDPDYQEVWGNPAVIEFYPAMNGHAAIKDPGTYHRGKKVILKLGVTMKPNVGAGYYSFTNVLIIRGQTCHPANLEFAHDYFLKATQRTTVQRLEKEGTFQPKNMPPLLDNPEVRS